MTMKDFLEKVKQHMGEYRKQVLKLNQMGRFRGLEYPHILYVDNYRNQETVIKKYNVLPFCKNMTFLLQNKCHRYAHHLNSSQIMCYNYFRPFIGDDGKKITKDLVNILERLNVPIKMCDYSTCEFEYEQTSPEWSNEGSRKTNFDFYVSSGEKEVFFEIKYTEYGFGTFDLKETDSHYKKFKNFYETKINNCPALYNGKIDFNEYYRKNYQLIRNVIRVTDKNKYVMFIYDANNKKVKTQLESFINNNIKKEYKRNIIGVTWQELVDYLESPHLDEFKVKYLDY